MVSILQRGLDAKYQPYHPIHEIIVQPNKNAPLLRKRMSQWKWFLTSEIITKERDLFYVTMKWSKKPLSENKELSPKEMFLGSSFLTKEKSQIYIEWLQHEKKYLLAIQKQAGIHFPSYHKQHLKWIEEKLYEL